MKKALQIGLPAILVLIGAVLAVFYYRAAPPAPPPVPVVAAAPALPATPPAPAPAPILPSFDAVRIAPDGQTVIAGRAAPGSEVTVLESGKVVGKVTADANGEWVLMPKDPLAPGARELSLEARPPNGGEASRSSGALAVIVPERQAKQEPAVAVLVPQNGEAARAFQAPDTRVAHTIVLDIVEFDPAGHTNLAGRADDGATVDVFVNERKAGTSSADAAGLWSRQLGDAVPLGRFRLRLSAHAADGSSAGELVLELRRLDPSELGPNGALAVVPGNSLWHLAQHSYGDGLRYVEIYRANQRKIDNPDLIFPGQLLKLPEKGKS
jgi:nucleoid-associated protein YgaU